MTIAYLTNQYPKVSHTFVRREICALETRGWQIARFSVQRTHDTLHDPADLAEAKCTRVLLDGGVPRLGRAWLETQWARPAPFRKALRLALKMGRHSERGIARHMAYLAEACVLRQACAAQGIHHIHVHHGTNPAAVALLCKVLGGPSYSLTVHGPEEFANAERLSLDEKIAGAAFVVSVSAYGHTELLRWCKRQDRAKVYTVRCGIDDAFLTVPPTSVPDVARVVCVGRLEAQKDPLTLVHALAELNRTGTPCELVWIGDGPLRAEIERAIQQHTPHLPIALLGWANNGQVLEHMRSARALVLSSHAENIPMAVMEAFALHRPVVSTNVGGIGELVQDGVSGWLVPPRSPHALAEALRQVLRTPVARLDEMGRAGAMRVHECYTAARQAEQMEGLFRSIGCVP